MDVRGIFQGSRKPYCLLKVSRPQIWNCSHDWCCTVAVVWFLDRAGLEACKEQVETTWQD